MTASEQLNRFLECLLQSSAASAEAVLRPLRDYDRMHGGDLVHTLRVYLTLGGNASRAADALYLHRSGLLYRLSRIESLMGIRLDSFRDRVALEVAVLAVTEARAEPPA